MNTAQFVRVPGHRMSLLDGEQSYLQSDAFWAFMRRLISA